MTEIAAIISLWKRNYLEEQLESLLAQSLPPKEIVLVQNEASMLDVGPIVRKFSGCKAEITCVKADVNYKYFFRFAIGSLVQTEYLFFVDDDIIPGKHWLGLCVEKSCQYNAIISPTGRIIPKDSFRPEKMFIYRRPERYVAGDATDEEENSSVKDRLVDYGCNSYFIRSEWIKHFWSIWPQTLSSGEDIHLSASFMLGDAIPTVVPQQTTLETSGNLRRHYGGDEHAAWRRKDFIPTREMIFRYLILEKNWRPILWRQIIE
jgi:hypothetical protein